MAQLERASPLTQSTEAFSLVRQSGPPLPGSLVLNLAALMAEVQTRYPNQVLAEGTPDMYLAAWAQLVVRHGMTRFTKALSKAIDASKFFPDPSDLGDICAAMEREAGAVKSSKQYIQAQTQDKIMWLRDYLDDVAKGIKRAPLSVENQRVAEALQSRDAEYAV